MANDIKWFAQHSWDYCQRSIFAQGKALHRSLRRFRNCFGSNESKRRQMDITTANDWAQARESGWVSSHRVIWRKGSAKARNSSSCLVSAKKSASRADSTKYAHRGSSVFSRSPITGRSLELQLQDRKICCISGTRRRRHWNWHSILQVCIHTIHTFNIFLQLIHFSIVGVWFLPATACGMLSNLNHLSTLFTRRNEGMTIMQKWELTLGAILRGYSLRQLLRSGGLMVWERITQASFA